MQQIHTVSGLASSVSDDNARDELLMKHAQSVCSQLRNLLVTPQNAQTLVEAVKGADMGNRHKDAILNAISERLAENLSKTSKQSRPNQAIEDVAPFLTASDVQFLEKAEYSLLARAQRVADVYARIFCWNPNEPSCGKAIHLLQQHFACPDLANPQVFYNSLQDFKARLKAMTSNKTPPTTRVANFTVPDALPADIYDMAFKNEPPVGLTRSTSIAGMGGPPQIGQTSPASSWAKSCGAAVHAGFQLQPFCHEHESNAAGIWALFAAQRHGCTVCPPGKKAAGATQRAVASCREFTCRSSRPAKQSPNTCRRHSREHACTQPHCYQHGDSQSKSAVAGWRRASAIA